MKILLVATNQADRFMDRMVVRPVPIGLAYLAASVDESRHEMRVLDLMFSEDGPGDVEGAMREFVPDLVGLSIRNLDNQSAINSVWNLPAVREIVERIRGVSEATILCGGPAFSILPAECLKYVGADLGIAGDAAEAFATLVDRLESGADYEDIPGIVYRRDDGDVVVSEGRFVSDFHNSPRLDLLDMRKYNGSGFGIGVVTKLAQAYYPTLDSSFDGDDWRARPPEEVVEEVAALNRDFGVNKIFFIDSGFNIPAEAAKSLCIAILESGLKIRWNSYIRPGSGDEELFQLMKRSGCSLALMSESGRARGEISDRLNALEETAGMCEKAGLPFTMNVSFGEPGETCESVERKIEFLESVKPAFAALRLGTRILPNTGMARTALAEGLVESESDLLRPLFYIEREVREWLEDRLREEAETHPRWNLS